MSDSGAIKKLRTPDIGQIQNLLIEHAGVFVDFAQILRYCVESCAYAFVVTHGSQIIGVVAGRMISSEKLAAIDILCVHRSFRRQGWAQRLMASFLNVCEPAVLCTLEVRQSNNAAKALYRKYGFREYDVKQLFYSNENALTMQLDVQRVVA